MDTKNRSHRHASEVEGNAINEWIRETPMRQLADQLGIPELPMSRPEFNFYRHALYQLKQFGFSGQELFHAAHEVIQTLFFKITKGTPGPIYQYVNWYNKRIAKDLKPPPFDQFFQYAFRQKSLTARKNWLRLNKKRGLSLDYDKSDLGLGDDIGYGEPVSTGPSPEEAMAEREESGRREKIIEEIPKMLAEHRLGDKYIPVWGLMKEHYKLADMAEELNARGILAPRGGPWGTGSVHKVRNQVYGMVKRFLEQQGVDWESISASRNGFRFGFTREG